MGRSWSDYGRFLLGLAFFFLLNGCQINYYWHLFRGQARIILSCEPIDGLLADPDLSPHILNKLIFIKKIKEFATDYFGLEESSNYTCFFDTEGHPVSWNISASPPDRFEPYLWEFPIVGKVPYKGFFTRELGLRERDNLRARNLDVMLRPVSAYSTLGFFSDPVLSTMIDYPEESLADLILHELTHGTIYVKGHADFNESLATFVGQTGSLTFLAATHGPDAPLIQQTIQGRKDQGRFRAFMKGVVGSLDSLYSLGLSREAVIKKRQEVFRRAQDHFKAIRSEFTIHNYDGFLDWKVNNARLLSYRRYHRNLDRFATLYSLKNKRMDLTLATIKTCEDATDPWTCLQDSITMVRTLFEQNGQFERSQIHK